MLAMTNVLTNEIEEIYREVDHVHFEEILDAPITLTELESHIKRFENKQGDFGDAREINAV